MKSEAKTMSRQQLFYLLKQWQGFLAFFFPLIWSNIFQLAKMRQPRFDSPSIKVAKA